MILDSEHLFCFLYIGYEVRIEHIKFAFKKLLFEELTPRPCFHQYRNSLFASRIKYCSGLACSTKNYRCEIPSFTVASDRCHSYSIQNVQSVIKLTKAIIDA